MKDYTKEELKELLLEVLLENKNLRANLEEVTKSKDFWFERALAQKEEKEENNNV
jgi:hypothetical protein